jgi:hypothetical protein
MAIGQRYTDADYYLKWGVIGAEGSGKTHFAIDAARFRPDKPVVVFNLEPKSNLLSVLRRFPDVYARTTVLPTDEDLDMIADRTFGKDPSEDMLAYDEELAWYVVEKVISLEKDWRDEVKRTFFIFDTASQIYQKLMWRVLEQRETDDRLKRMAQLAYSEPKRKFETMINRTAMWQTDVIWLGRTKQGGEEVVDRQTGKTRWVAVAGKEDPEWKNMLRYQATVLIHLTREEEHVMDTNNSFVMDANGIPLKREVRYAKIMKHKSGRSGIPTIKDPNPAKVMAWLRGLDQQTPTGNTNGLNL